jgi:hypothetical protein
VDLHRELQVMTSQKTCAWKAVAVEVSTGGDSLEVESAWRFTPAAVQRVRSELAASHVK